MSSTSRPLHIFPISLREVEIAAMEDLSPSYRRITFRGPQLLGGQRDGHDLPALRSLGFDDHVKIVVPPPGVASEIGVQGEHNFEWAPGALTHARDYTVRRWDGETGELVIDVVRHEGGLAASWVMRASVGDTAHCAGPKSSSEANPDVDWHLLIGDETAQPAIARWLEEAPAGARARVFLEVPDQADIRVLKTAADAEVTWLVRDAGTPAGWSTQLLAAVQSFAPWPGRGFAWCAGETITIKPIRRHLRTLLPKEDVEVVGYWRRIDHGSDGVPESSPHTVVREVLRDTDIVTPLVLRATVTLGLPHTLVQRPISLPALATALGLPAHRLAPLVDSLQALDYLKIDGGLLRLTAKGEVLTEDLADHLSLTHPHAQEELALLDLVNVLRTGTPNQGEATGDPHRRELQAEDELTYVLDPLSQLPPVRDAAQVLVSGEGGLAVATALASPNRRITVVVPDDTAASARERHRELPAAQRDRITMLTESEPPPRSECTVCLGETAAGSVGELADTVNRLVSHTSTSVVLVNEVADGAERDGHRAGHALLALTLTGHPLLRTHEIEAVVAQHGEVSSQPLGWGFAHHVTWVDLTSR